MNCEIPSYFPLEDKIEERKDVDLELIKRQITDHVNLELKRFARELNSIKEEGSYS